MIGALMRWNTIHGRTTRNIQCCRKQHLPYECCIRGDNSVCQIPHWIVHHSSNIWSSWDSKNTQIGRSIPNSCSHILTYLNVRMKGSWYNCGHCIIKWPGCIDCDKFAKVCIMEKASITSDCTCSWSSQSKYTHSVWQCSFAGALGWRNLAQSSNTIAIKNGYNKKGSIERCRILQVTNC